MVHPITLIY